MSLWTAGQVLPLRAPGAAAAHLWEDEPKARVLRRSPATAHRRRRQQAQGLLGPLAQPALEAVQQGGR